MFIGLTGPAGSGKDTVADYLVGRYGFKKLAFASTLKAMMAVAGMPEPPTREEKEMHVFGFSFTWREAAQKLGTEFGRGLDPDIWVKLIGLKVCEIFDTEGPDTNIVISDVRFENEAYMIRSMGGLVIHIAGRAADLGVNAGHASESGVMFHPLTDHLVNNKGEFQYTSQQVDAIVKAAP